MTCRYHLGIGEVGFQPRDDEVHGGAMIDRVTIAPFVRVDWFAARRADDEVRIALHAVDATTAEQRKRYGCIDRIGAELEAGGTGVEDDDGFAHQQSLRSFDLQDGGIVSQRVGVKHGGCGREAMRGFTAEEGLV